MKNTVLLNFVLLLVTAALAPAVIIQVPGEYGTIQAAINAAVNGDFIIVNPGLYNENINFRGKAITVSSTNPDDPNTVKRTIIDANGVGSVITFASNEGPDAVLTGFTITGGKGTLDTSSIYDIYWGAGIYCYGASPTITDNVIADNNSFTKIEGDEIIALGYGGGISCLQSGAIVTRNVITKNNAYAGAGIMVAYRNPAIISNLIHDNSGEAGGGVVLLEGGRLTSNTLAGNYAAFGGNAYVIGWSLIENNIICNARSGGGILFEGPIQQGSVAYNNVFDNSWDNAEGNYLIMVDLETLTVELDDQTGLNGNISIDPVFVNPDANDYHLQASSPCKDAGDPCGIFDLTQQDIDGEPRVMDYRVDIGADEYPGNLRPIADAGLDQTMSAIPSLVTLDGSGSYDPSGDTLTYHWNQIDGPVVDLTDANAVAPTFVPSEPGTYVFELLVNDGLIDSYPDTVGIVIGDNQAPVADAGPVRYAGPELVLDGTGSYDPDGYGTLTYQWRQVSGPNAFITDANTAKPTVAFTQTTAIQECRFELIVSDGYAISLPDTAKVIVVPNFSGTTVVLENPPFDFAKPTVIYFAGGDGGSPFSPGPPLETKANIISFSTPHNGSHFDRHGNAIIAYLSGQAPNYNQPIQTMGHSNGGKLPAAVGAYINTTYADRRYNVNRATFLDDNNTGVSHIANFVNSGVDGEPCWVDNYFSTHGRYYQGVLNVRFSVPPADHGTPFIWYILCSLDPTQWPGGNIYNGGVTAGGYLSVIGPGKNLQLSAEASNYYFKWVPVTDIVNWTGYVDFYNESSYPGRLPEPVTLVGPEDGAVVDANGAVLSCEESENAVGYELLFGRDPYRVSRYMLICETASPPNEVITEFPFEKTYWTIKVRDQYGSTIYADPICIRPEHITPPTRVIKNLTTGETYDHIQTAIDDAAADDELVLRPGISSYPENIDFKGKKLTLRSIDPNDPNVVANTVINGGNWKPALTFANSEDTTCTVNGLTITGGSSGIHCSGADTMPRITNCLVTANNGAGIELTDRGEAMIENCLITANSGAGVEQTDGGAIIENSVIAENQADGVQGTLARSMITNCTIAANAGTGIKLIDSSAKVTNCIIWLNSGVAIDCDEIIRVRSAYSNIQGGFPGDGNIDTDPCFAGPANRDYHLQSQVGRWNPSYQTWVTDANTSLCIDAGDPNSDWTGELWPHGKWINMGAYGGTPQASMSLSSAGNIADLNDDHFVNWQDLKLLADKWLHEEVLLPEDLSRDGLTNYIDYAILANEWLWEQ